jgi:ABC-type lipoprotein export system ATPase subunit
MVLDEPTAHQDEDHAKVVLAALQSARGVGTCCLLATHADEVVAVLDRVVTMTDGRVLHARPRRPPQPK